MSDSSEVLKYETDGRKAIITLNRPDAMNALNAELRDALGAAIKRYEADDHLLVAILAGEGGRAFSVGGDVKEKAQDDSAGSDGRNERLQCFYTLDAAKKPIIAAVDGYCLGGGLELMIFCDSVVATEKSAFGLPETRRSLLPGPGINLLSTMIPYREALSLQLTGGRMSAQRAYQVGLIQRLVPDRDAMWVAAHEIADEILLCAPLAVQATKRIVKEGRQLPLEYWESLLVPIRTALYATEDRLEGPRAFAEKRAPQWKMR